jgi:branched-chain amino acid transport system substrate-binding protein
VVAVTACGSSGSNNSGAPGGEGGSSSSGTGLTKSEIVIGNVGVYSGTAFGAQYSQSLHGLQAWVQWTNDHGGINGHPVKLVSKDDANNPATSLQAVKELVEQDHAVAILAPTAPGTDNAWAKYVEQKKVPVIGGIALEQVWLENPYMLSVNNTPVGYLTGQFGAAKSIGSKLGVFTCAELAACKSGIPLFPNIAKSVGLQYAGTQLVSATATDYTAQCLAIKNAGADVVVPEVDGPTIVRIIKACNTQGYKPAIVVPSSDIDADVLANPAFNGTLGVTVSPLWFGDSDLTKDWAQAYKALYPNEVLNGYSTLGWQAGVVFATALKNAPDTVTSDTVLQALYAQPANSTFGGWTPPITFVKDKPTQTGACLWYTKIQDGKLVAPDGNKFSCPQGSGGTSSSPTS